MFQVWAETMSAMVLRTVMEGSRSFMVDVTFIGCGLRTAAD
jgi:hypothetical protein